MSNLDQLVNLGTVETLFGSLGKLSTGDLTWRFILEDRRGLNSSEFKFLLERALTYAVNCEHEPGALVFAEYLRVWVEEVCLLALLGPSSEVVRLAVNRDIIFFDPDSREVKLAFYQARQRQAHLAREFIIKSFPLSAAHLARKTCPKVMMELLRWVLRAWGEACRQDDPAGQLDFWVSWRKTANARERQLFDDILKAEAGKFKRMNIADALCWLVPKDLAPDYQAGQDEELDNRLAIAELLKYPWTKQTGLAEIRAQAQKLVDIQLPVNSK